MFSPETYYRMVEALHGWLWPLHILIFVVIIVLAINGRLYAGKWTVLLFGLSWLFVGVVFFYYQFAPIFWAADYIALAFVAQGLLLIVTSLLARDFIKDSQQSGKLAIYSLLVVALLFFPISTIISGRSLATSDLVFVTPDPTVVATFSLLCAIRASWWMFPIPIFWSVFSGLLLYAMESPWFWVVPLSALVAVIIRVMPLKFEAVAE